MLYLRDPKISKSPYFPQIDGKAPKFLKIHISKRLDSKVLKFCTQASLIESSMWAKFQIKIQSNDLIQKIGVVEGRIH